MHFARSFTALLTVFAGVASVASATPTPTSHAALAKRQPHALKQFNPLAAIEEKRGFLDICVDVKVNLAAELSKLFPQLKPLIPDLGVKVDLCLCAGLIPTFVQANLVTQLAATILGKDVVVDALLKILLGLSPQQHHCEYPAHSFQKCTAGKPCDFGCKDGYVLKDGQCVCPAPLHECNGKCQSASCPVPSKRWAHDESARAFSNFSKKSGMARIPAPLQS